MKSLHILAIALLQPIVFASIANGQAVIDSFASQLVADDFAARAIQRRLEISRRTDAEIG